ncbi:AraC family transcriptional regulator [Paenibacillus sp. CF384]|uniref:AraC family transcriptional regulator n=1 Tax=Paenibacillus sp. CF384 TaxID=1884382 RepID=UPI000894AA63|nr:AraC family transcriptional regulator [Paenibacillus sp. CF384]SDX96859.1 AraC-like ligand binding domain-containing protein [Paenibacillus sp. CF384]
MEQLHAEDRHQLAYAHYREWSPSIHYAKYQSLPPGKLPRRRLYDYEILYVSQGEAATTIRETRYEWKAGQLIYLPAGLFHQNEVVSQPNAQFLGIHFDYFDELEVGSDEDMVVNETHPLAEKFCREAMNETFPPLSEQIIYTPSLLCVQLMEQLVEEFTTRPPGYELACKALMLNILSQLQRSRSTLHQRAADTVHGQRLLSLMKQMESSLSESWSNKRLADSLLMNEDHAAKLFKQVAGQPPGEFLRSIRHREARRLLRETDLSVEEVGERTGCPDIHYFSRQFRKQEGLSPSMYRKLSRVL